MQIIKTLDLKEDIIFLYWPSILTVFWW